MIRSKRKSDRFYIGSAVNIRKRWSAHRSYLVGNYHHCKKLQNHYNKYGAKDLVFSVITGCDVEELLRVEQFYLDIYNPWFNTCKIAGNTRGIEVSEETRKKLSEKRRARPSNRKGVKLTEEHKRKISEAQMGEKNSMYGKPSPNKGRHCPNKFKGKRGRYSEETLEKMRIANKRAWKIRKQNKAA